ncbi:MAG TPA: D-alanyl-D-alanine carboxypeptidase [Actinomycetota bacterium]|nr:D-alanyl-D-alanine carboxypeptidase [Actinomycetota bacterium]
MRGPHLRLGRSLSTIVCVIGLAVAGLAAPARADAAAATITSAIRTVVFGDPVPLAAAVTGDPACIGPRPIELDRRSAADPDWVPVAQATTAPDGTAAFSDPPTYTSSYRVTLPATATCPALESGTLSVRVRVRIDSSLLGSSLTAGSCVQLAVTVAPGKPGQSVELQRRTSSGWATVDDLTLDAGSSASARPCFGWDDLGIVRLRARWAAQDALNASSTGAPLPFRITQAPWMRRVSGAIGDRSMSVAVGDDGVFLYRHADATPRAPASNEKLLLSMALLDELGPSYRIPTIAAAERIEGHVIPGDLWILGRGDPTLGPARLAVLARRIAAAGITRIEGRVMGATTYFARDWWATGWKPEFRREEVALPTALTFEGNSAGGVHIRDPERRAAEWLVTRLERLGVAVGDGPGAGAPPGGLRPVATVRSEALAGILRRMNVPSDNFVAEVLGKLLSARRGGPPGTIAGGARQIQAWSARHGVEVTSFDGSGLSYADRVTAEGIVQLLWVADGSSWVPALRASLPAAGQGTLQGRLGGVRLRAKTGTLTDVSALSGWVWSRASDGWIEFSILSSGMPKWMASSIEDRVVRILASSA